MTPAAGRAPLAGRGIVITRPAPQAGRLVELVRALGGRPFVCPAIEIRDPPDPAPLHELVARLASFDFAVFVSPSAVVRAMEVITAVGPLPPGLTLAVVGPGSAGELRRYTDAPVLAPTARFDSEGLLELPQLRAPRGKRVVIFRGQGGREHLGESLAARGAHVEYAQCYVRAKPELDLTPLIEAWAGGSVNAVIVTSSQALRNLTEMLGEDGGRALRETPTFVSHPRIARAAGELGLKKVIEAAPGDETMVDHLCRYFEG
jgi:uroporphyrinogen-III synthase